MIPTSRSGPPLPAMISPLILSDSLITLAEQAHHAGYPRSARRLLRLAISVLDEGPPPSGGCEPAAG